MNVNDITKQLTGIVNGLINGERLDISKNNLDMEIEQLQDNDQKELYKAIVKLAQAQTGSIEYITELSKGNLEAEAPRKNLWLSPLKQLHSILKHLVWQIQRVSEGDLNQNVDFLGSMSVYFNNLIASLKEKKEVEQALKDSEEKYRLITDFSADVVWVLNINSGKFSYISPAIYYLRGLTVEEAMAEKMEDALEKESLDFVNDSVAKAIEVYSKNPGKPYYSISEVRQPTKDGKIIWVEVATNYRINKFNEIEVVGVSRNIDKRKKAEEALQESQEKYRLLIEKRHSSSMSELKKKNEALDQQSVFTSALDAIADVIIYNENHDDILEKANRILGETLQLDRSVIYKVSFEKNQITGLCEWLQTTSSEITPTIGNYPFDWFIGPLSELKKTRNYLESHFDAVNEHFIEDGSGVKLHKGMNIKSLIWYPFDFDEQGFYVFTLNQVLEQKQWTPEDISFIASVAKQVSIAILKIRLLDERKLVQESEIKLRELNAAKDKFFSIIAHDLKSPFTSIIGFSEVLVEQVRKRDYEGISLYSEIIRQSSNRAMNLLMNLMEWAQSQTGRMEFNPEHFEMVAFINETTLLYHDIAGQKSIAIKNILPINALVFADKAMISTVFRNLISNAIKFTMPGGEVIVSAVQEQNQIIFSVSDTGVGIPKNSIEKLFRIDQSYSTTGTNKEEGTGLGLILCKEFVEKHGGKIWVESEEKTGSTFYFTVPCIANPEEKTGIENSVPAVRENHVIKLKILIAEDDETSEMLISIMVNMFGNEILRVRTGVEAVEICRNNTAIDLIIMDIQMPKMGGYEATRQIRQFNKDVIIIAQTAYVFSGDRKKAIEAGCNDYISKPINKDELFALIKKYFK